MTRKNQLGLLILLSALTMAIPYAIQGALSTGTTPSQIHPNVYVADRIAWAIRALVEGLVIGYIARTHANTKLQGFVLWVLKLALIGLIAITLGPVLYATSTGLPIQQTMSEGWHRFWAYALASYMPLMVLGAAYAYKTQPTDNEVEPVDNESVAELERLLAEAQAENERLEEVMSEGNNEVKILRHKLASTQNETEAMQTQLATMQTQHGIAFDDATRFALELAEIQEKAQATQTQLETMQTQAQTLADWNLLNATAKAVWIAQHTNGDRPPASHLAKALGCAVSTVSRAYETVDRGKANGRETR